MEARFRSGIAKENRGIAAAYYGESFARTKRLKKLSDYLIDPSGKPKGKTNQSTEDMLSIMQELQAGGAAMEFKFIPNDPEQGED